MYVCRYVHTQYSSQYCRDYTLHIHNDNTVVFTIGIFLNSVAEFWFGSQ